VILFLHNRYRTTGGEERVVEDLMWLVREHLGEEVALLERGSAGLSRRRAATGLLRGGLDPGEVGAAVRRSGASVVHAHNLLPGLGWRALAAARAAGAAVVLHLHNYRLVCAVGTCVDPSGSDCTRCHGVNTAPGVRLNCRGTGAEAVAYGLALALHQRRLVSCADVVVVPSTAAAGRLAELGAPLDPERLRILGHVQRQFVDASRADRGGFALVASRLAREKGVEAAVDACRAAGVPLVIAGDGPLRADLEARACGADVRFAGWVEPTELAALRAEARVALAPSRAVETFGLSAVEAMAAGVPVVAARIGALAELGEVAELVAPGDAAEMAAAITRVAGDRERGQASIAFARERCGPEAVGPALAAVYETARACR
jgi:glycosyltransferase involved in cell wall biosynthesis